MKFTIRKSELTEITNAIAGVIPKKNIKPILAGVMIEKQDDKIVFEATDMESSIKVVSRAIDIEGDGKYVIDAKTLLEVAKNAYVDDVKFNLEKNIATAKVGSGNIKLPVMNADDYPEIFFDDGEEIGLSAEIMHKLINKTMFSASKDEMVRNLNGILWEIEGNTFRMVTADSYRMAIAEETIDKVSENSISFFVSLKSMQNIKRIIKKDLTLKYSNTKIAFTQGNTTYSTRLMDVNFPNYKAVLPSNFQTEIKADRKELTDTLKLLSVIAKSEGDTVVFDIKNNVLKINARSIDRGDGEMMLDCTGNGVDITVAFDPKFLIEGLNNFDNDTIDLLFVDAENALQMQQDENALHIIMPVKIKR